VHAVQADQFAWQGKTEHLFIAIFGRTVGFQGARANRKQGVALVTGTKDVLPGLVGLLAFNDLVQCVYVITAHAVRQAQLGQAAVAAGGLDISDFQRFAFGGHSG
jgi:hypothetical protein